jgi:hypothetical protein
MGSGQQVEGYIVSRPGEARWFAAVSFERALEQYDAWLEEAEHPGTVLWSAEYSGGAA